MKGETIRFKDLSGWLKFAFIWTVIYASILVFTILLWAIIGFGAFYN